MREYVSLDARHRVVYDMLLASKNELILDVGCAWGYFMGFLLKYRKCRHQVGVDIVLQDLKVSKKRVPESNVILASALNLPFRENSFDKAIAAEVIEHLPEKTEKKALKEIHYVLKNNGTLILSTPNDLGLLNYLDPEYPMHRHYNAEYLISLLQNLGFSIKELHLKGSILHLIAFWIKIITNYPFRSLNKPKPKIIDQILNRLIDKYAYIEENKKYPQLHIFIKIQKTNCD